MTTKNETSRGGGISKLPVIGLAAAILLYSILLCASYA